MDLITVACIPAYNVGKIIGSVVSDIFNYVDKVIVCDDGSIDNTAEIAKSNGAIVISHEKNLGKGAALKTLFEHAKKIDFDVLVTIDGDGQFLPNEIPKLMAPILKNKSDIVLGYRFENNLEMPSYRKFGNKMLDKFTNMASDMPFRDTQSGFRAYSKKAIEKINFSSNGFGADSEILINASNKQLIISEEKITVLYNTGDKTSTHNPVSQFVTVVNSLIELIAIRRPLKFLGIPGLLILFFGIYYSILVITIFNETRYFSIPSTLVAVTSLTIGLLLLLISIILFAINRAMKQ